MPSSSALPSSAVVAIDGGWGCLQSCTSSRLRHNRTASGNNAAGRVVYGSNRACGERAASTRREPVCVDFWITQRAGRSRTLDRCRNRFQRVDPMPAGVLIDPFEIHVIANQPGPDTRQTQSAIRRSATEIHECRTRLSCGRSQRCPVVIGRLRPAQPFRERLKEPLRSKKHARGRKLKVRRLAERSSRTTVPCTKSCRFAMPIMKTAVRAVPASPDSAASTRFCSPQHPC